jgi:hypothetical protein
MRKKRQMNECSNNNINHNNGNDDQQRQQQQQQREVYNPTDGSIPENQESITINNILSRNIPVKEKAPK